MAARQCMKVLVVIASSMLADFAAGQVKPKPAEMEEQPITAEKTDEIRAKVTRKDGKVRIEGVPVLTWGKGKDCTFAGALEAALGVTKFPYSYTDIMGMTGLAFRTRWYQGRTGDKWCPSSPVGEFPDEIAAISKSDPARAKEFNADALKLLQEAKTATAKFFDGPVTYTAWDRNRKLYGWDKKRRSVMYKYEPYIEKGIKAVKALDKRLAP